MTVRNATVAALAVALGAIVPAGSADEVRLVPGSSIQAAGDRLRGSIDRETPNEVVIGGKSVPIDQIESVEYDGAPVSLSQARLQEANGDPARAMELYQKAATEAGNKPLIAQAARFGRARVAARQALADPARRPAAIRDLEGLSAGLATTRHHGPLLELLADLYEATDQVEKADQALEKLGQLGWAADRATIRRATLQARRGEPEAALQTIDRLIAGQPEGSPGRARALLGRAEALAALKRYDEAEGAVRELIAATGPEDAAALATAYNTLGSCLRAAGRGRDALFAYLHTDILYPGSAEEHAEALAQIAALWAELERSDRSAEAVERLKREYPNSPQAAAAAAPIAPPPATPR